MTIAFIADIHANVWALQAVLDDIHQRGITRIYDLGDSLYGPLEPAATYQLLNDQQVLSISGNQDRYILENQTPNPTFDYVCQALRHTDALTWLASLPTTRILHEQLLLCHGTPTNDSEYLLETVQPGYVTLREADEIAATLLGYDQPLVLCGHSHLPRLVQVSTQLVVNPGSVGLQAYQDESPLYHKMENGSPLARYGLVELTATGNRVALVGVGYDWEAAAASAQRHGRPDWAHRLRTGRV